MTVVGIQLIDRVGRRRLLLIGAIGMCVCEFIVAIVGVTAGHINPITQAVNVPAQKVLIAFVCMYVLFSSLLLFSFFSLYLFFSHRYIAFFAISWGPVAWVITGEIFVSFSFFLVLIKHITYFTKKKASRNSSKRNVIICRKQLVMELWYRLRNSIPRQPNHYWYKRNQSCQFGC